MRRASAAIDTRAAHPRLKPADIANYAVAALGFLVREGHQLPGTHRPPAGHHVPDDFAGVCVASSPDPRCDEYVLGRLRDMGVRHVRLDYTYGSELRHTARFLEHLLDHSIHVLLHLVQPPEEAHAMRTPGAQARWRAFLERTLDRWGGRIEAVEIGSTVNRRKWARYTPDRFRTAWRIAHEEVRQRSLTLAGPNVTDFEPVYNIALLREMKASGLLPDVHTNNLFAERSTEPERYDHKILGRTLAPTVKFNLVKKARSLQQVAASAGLDETWSTHVAWSKRRINRILPDVEEKQADYLARYFLLAAASGALSRVYWGPMIGQREGIVDDGTEEYPEPIPHVARYEHVYGEVDEYRVRPALHTMKTFTELIPGARYDGPLARAHGLEVHAFNSPRGVVHALWTMNGRGADPASLYDARDLTEAEWIGRDGERLSSPPPLITEAPIYARWSADHRVEVKRGAGPIPRLVARTPVHLYQEGDWRGAVNAETETERDRLLAALSPQRLPDADRQEILRDARNTVWTTPHPTRAGESVVVKRALLKPLHKKALSLFKPSKARRSWNGAWELLRRGVETPRPIAFFEMTDRAPLRENFYICAHIPGGLTARRFLRAYGQGEDVYEGVAMDDFFRRLVDFLFDMHRRGVHYRDAAPGNILVEKRDDGSLRFLLVDTGRARFFERPATIRERLSDLKRTSHPLDWESRRRFIELYLERCGRRFTPLRRLPFRLFDAKQRRKQWWKRQRRRWLGGKPAAAATTRGLACLTGPGALQCLDLLGVAG